jgi:hypothetical protein
VAALALYVRTLAPSITWAHHGADSGELLAAVVTNGVPHPPGYPLYMILLGFWLNLTGGTLPDTGLAWRGNLLSAACAALSVGVTVLVLGHLLQRDPWNWLWALLAGLAWAVSPLLWSQALITEVYALHALLVALLGWALLCREGRSLWLAPILVVGFAHHLTFVLLMPATVYYLWTATEERPWTKARRIGLLLAVSGALGALFYLRTPLVAGAQPPPPVNWGYADNVEGFWWLVSGSAYRSYLFNLEAKDMLGRVASWAYTVTTQYTPVGLGIALIGLSYLDGNAPRIRNFSLLWIVPVSLYSISYYTRDSEIYLLSVSWLMAIWIGIGLAVLAGWLGARWVNAPWRTIVAAGGAVGVAILLALHLPQTTLRHDREATAFLTNVNDVVEPGSIIITTGDSTTFAVWYGAWGDGSLLAAAPDAVIVNYSLYQFDWYRRLLDNLYPTVPNVGLSVSAMVDSNAGKRPIYLTEKIPVIPEERLFPAGPLWRVE